MLLAACLAAFFAAPASSAVRRMPGSRLGGAVFSPAITASQFRSPELSLSIGMGLASLRPVSAALANNIPLDLSGVLSLPVDIPMGLSAAPYIGDRPQGAPSQGKADLEQQSLGLAEIFGEGPRSPFKEPPGFIPQETRDPKEKPKKLGFIGFIEPKDKPSAKPMEGRNPIGFIWPEPEPPKPPAERTVLVAGFEPFRDIRTDTSKEIALYMDSMTIDVYQKEGEQARTFIHGKDIPKPEQPPEGKLLGSFRVIGRVLPYGFEGAGDRIERWLAEIKPNVTLILGLSRKNPEIQVEAFAKNFIHSFGIADAEGNVPNMRTVIPGAPPVYGSNAPAQRLVEGLKNLEHKVSLSQDAGCFVCNSTYYLALSAVRNLALDTVTLMARIPSATEHLAEDQQGKMAHQPLSTLRDAAARLAQWLAHQATGAVEPPTLAQ